MLLKTILNRVHQIKGFIYTDVKLEEYPALAITVNIKSRFFSLLRKPMPHQYPNRKYCTRAAEPLS